MAWARLDDGWHDHPKVIAAGLDAAGLWVMCLTWAHANRRGNPRPGYVPKAVLSRFASGARGTRLATRLVDVGLFDATDGGWLIHDFVKYLPKYDPEKAAEAGRKGADQRWRQGRGGPPDPPPPDGEPPPNDDGDLPSEPIANRMANGSRTHGSRASVRRNPVPVPTDVTGHQRPPVTKAVAHEPMGGRMPDLIDQVRAVRPFWSPVAISAAARRCAEVGRSYEATVAALLAVADDPATVGPARVVADGPWWRPATERTTRSTTDERVAQGLALADALDRSHVTLRALPGGAA